MVNRRLEEKRQLLVNKRQPKTDEDKLQGIHWVDNKKSKLSHVNKKGVNELKTFRQRNHIFLQHEISRYKFHQ